MKSALAAHERFIRERLKSRKAEALGWLKRSHGRNTLGELPTTEEATTLVKAIYAAGAERVIAVEIDEYDDGQNTGKLVIRLPTDPARRQRVFAWHGKQAQSMGFDAEPDIGQSHLFSLLD